MQLYQSSSLDPHWNLAAEDYLLDQAAGRGPILLLWQSHDTVVIGKNQNPWRECDLGWMEDHGVQLARRITGGGAVYHDGGNLNYTFCCARDRYRQDEVYMVLLRGLQTIGIPAERMGKSSLSVDGSKISGNAFCYRRDGVLHHGTLLVGSRLDRLERSLRPSLPGVETRAVASEPASVINLSDLDPAWTLEAVEDAVAAGFADRYGAITEVKLTDDLEPVSMDRRHRRFLSDAWRRDRTPTFQVSLAHRFSWGEMALELTVSRGRIVEAGDRPGLVDLRFEADSIASAWTDAEPRRDIRTWLRSKGI